MNTKNQLQQPHTRDNCMTVVQKKIYSKKTEYNIMTNIMVDILMIGRTVVVVAAV